MPRYCRIPAIQSLVWATDIDVLEIGARTERRDDHWVISSPQNPEFWWGNFLLFDDAPGPGDGQRWERAFDAALGDDPRIRHRVFAWDRTDGQLGAHRQEFIDRGYALETTAGLIATPGQLRRHPRESTAVEVRALASGEGQDEDLWAQVIEIQVAARRPGFSAAGDRAFRRGRQRALREIFRSGRGAWYVALDTDRVVGSLGIVVTGGRARYQHVDTLASHRRRGIASRLVVEAARMAAATHPIERYVIAADPDYHAIGLYEELGFRRVERVAGVELVPPED